MRRGKYGARKTTCANGHEHPSASEARRCNELHLLERAGQIVGLEQQPVFKFIVNGEPVKLENGHTAGITADFSYIENGVKVAEDRKGYKVRDFPLRWALAKHLYPGIEWRIT